MKYFYAVLVTGNKNLLKRIKLLGNDSEKLVNNLSDDMKLGLDIKSRLKEFLSREDYLYASVVIEFAIARLKGRSITRNNYQTILHNLESFRHSDYLRKHQSKYIKNYSSKNIEKFFMDNELTLFRLGMSNRSLDRCLAASIVIKNSFYEYPDTSPDICFIGGNRNISSNESSSMYVSAGGIIMREITDTLSKILIHSEQRRYNLSIESDFVPNTELSTSTRGNISNILLFINSNRTDHKIIILSNPGHIVRVNKLLKEKYNRNKSKLKFKVITTQSSKEIIESCNLNLQLSGLSACIEYLEGLFWAYTPFLENIATFLFQEYRKT